MVNENRVCAYDDGLHHSPELVNVFHGESKSLTLCGYHASGAWLVRVLRRLSDVK